MPGFVLSLVSWYDPQHIPNCSLALTGLSRSDLPRFQEPARAVPEAVEGSRGHTSGRSVRFLTTAQPDPAPRLAGPPSGGTHAATGQCGFDCFLDDGQGLYYTTPHKTRISNVHQIIRLYKFAKNGPSSCASLPSLPGVSESVRWHRSKKRRSLNPAPSRPTGAGLHGHQSPRRLRLTPGMITTNIIATHS